MTIPITAFGFASDVMSYSILGGRRLLKYPQCRKCLEDPFFAMECKTRGGGALSGTTAVPVKSSGSPTLNFAIQLGQSLNLLLANLIKLESIETGQPLNPSPCKIERILVVCFDNDVLSTTINTLSTWAIKNKYKIPEFTHAKTLRGGKELLKQNNLPHKSFQLIILPLTILKNEASNLSLLQPSDLIDINIPVIVFASESDPITSLQKVQNNHSVQILTTPLTTPAIHGALNKVVSDLEGSTPLSQT